MKLKKYLRKQIREILSPENKWFTGEEVNHSPKALLIR